MLVVLTVDVSLRLGEKQEKREMKRRCLGIFTPLFRGCGVLPLGVRRLNSEPDLTGSAAEDAKEAVVAMDQRDLEWIPASAAQRCCDCVGPSTSSVTAVYATRNHQFITKPEQIK